MALHENIDELIALVGGERGLDRRAGGFEIRDGSLTVNLDLVYAIGEVVGIILKRRRRQGLEGEVRLIADIDIVVGQIAGEDHVVLFCAAGDLERSYAAVAEFVLWGAREDWLLVSVGDGVVVQGFDGGDAGLRSPLVR